MASLIVAAAVCLGWCAFALWLGPRIGFVDRPDSSPLKTHTRAAIPLGGVGVFLGVHLGAVVRGDIDVVLLVSSGVVLVLGLIDDRLGLSPRVRLGVEILAALILVAGTGSIVGPLQFVLGVLLVVFAINAVNLYDGLDGLAASAAAVTALGIAGVAAAYEASPAVPLELAAALGGFLVLGWHPAKVFLGDSGAYVIGLMLASSLLHVAEGDSRALIAASSLLGVFALDLLVTLLRRRRARRPLFTGDRSHIYDRLRDRGMSVPAVVAASAITQVLLVAIGLMVLTTMTPTVAALVMALVMGLSLGILIGSGFLRIELG